MFSFGATFLIVLAVNSELGPCEGRQSEARGNLKALFVAEEAFRGEYGTYSNNFVPMGFEPKTNNGSPPRYSYRVLAHTKTSFVAEARGMLFGRVDVWQISEANALKNTQNACERELQPTTGHRFQFVIPPGWKQFSPGAGAAEPACGDRNIWPWTRCAVAPDRTAAMAAAFFSNDFQSELSGAVVDSFANAVIADGAKVFQRGTRSSPQGPAFGFVDARAADGSQLRFMVLPGADEIAVVRFVFAPDYPPQRASAVAEAFLAGVSGLSSLRPTDGLNCVFKDGALLALAPNGSPQVVGANEGLSVRLGELSSPSPEVYLGSTAYYPIVRQPQGPRSLFQFELDDGLFQIALDRKTKSVALAFFPFGTDSAKKALGEAYVGQCE